MRVPKAHKTKNQEENGKPEMFDKTPQRAKIQEVPELDRGGRPEARHAQGARTGIKQRERDGG